MLRSIQRSTGDRRQNGPAGGVGRGPRENDGRRRTGTYFKEKTSIPLSYQRQGYIYFTCRAWEDLSDAQRRKIVQTAEQACGEYAPAVLRFVTTDESATRITAKYCLGTMTLYRAVKRFYLAFPRHL